MPINRRDFLKTTAITAAALSTTTASAQANSKYRACVIGDSDQGGYGHSLHMMWGLRDDIEVVALSDPNEQGRKEHAQECGAKKTYADYNEMLDKEKPDLIAIGPRWTINHHEYMMACVEHGCHGIMEKPLTPDLAQADAIIDAVDKAGLKWALAFNFRVSPMWQHARTLMLEDDLIGDILEVRTRGKEDHRVGGEDLIVLGVHTFDMTRNLLGDPAWCMAHVTEDGVPATRADIKEATEPLGPILGDSIEAMYGFGGGRKSFFASQKNEHGNGGRWGMDIYGSQGILTVRMGRVPAIHVLRDPSWAPGGSGKNWEPLPNPPAINFPDSPVGHYAPIVDGLITAIEKDTEPVCSLRDGRWAHEMIQGVWQSHLEGNTAVALPIRQRKHPLEA